MNSTPWIDLTIVVVYNLAVVALGCGFLSRATTSEQFMSAGRSLPGWAVGLSVFGSYVSSISFLANPGKAYGSNWSAFVLALSMPLAAWISVRWFVPFYRQSGEVSAYHHLEHRFGAWARTYAVACYLFMQLARLGTILYLLALALQPLIGGEVWAIIVVMGILVTIYPFLGGTEAVIWTGVVQAIVLIAGPIVCLAVMFWRLPDGAAQVFAVADAHQKFGVGPFSTDDPPAIFWVMLFFGFVTHLQNFGIDQGYVQRYLTAKTDRGAGNSIWLGTMLFIPVSASFFFIGTALFAYFRSFPDRLPASITKADQVFPHFIAHELPPGLTGLVIAAICAAAMDSNLNCSATLFLCDIYKRYLRPSADDRESLWVLRLSTLVIGGMSINAALAMIKVKTALDAWWELAAIFSGGMLGLFLLGMTSRRARSKDAAWGVAAGVTVILWMTLSPKLPANWLPLDSPWRSPFHSFLVLVIGTAVVLIVGLFSMALFYLTRKETAVAPPKGPP